MNDSGASEATVPFRYVEDSGCTYHRKFRGGGPDYDRYVFNFVIVLVDEVHSTVDDPIGGLIADLTVGERGPYKIFIPKDAWSSVSRFMDVIRKHPGVPALFQKISQPELNDYGFHKTEELKKASKGTGGNGYRHLKQRVVRIGFQTLADEIAVLKDKEEREKGLHPQRYFVLGENAVYEVAEQVVLVDMQDTNFMWTSGLLRELTLPSENLPFGQPFTEIASMFPKETVVPWGVVTGGMLMGLHSERIREELNACPTVICKGQTGTGKSLCTSVSGRIIAPNADKILEYKQITASSLRDDVFAKQNLPVILHDPSDPEVVIVLVEETFEARPISKKGERVVPHCTALVSCNEDTLARIRAQGRMRVMSRCVLIPFTKPVHLTTMQQVKVGELAHHLARYLPRFLQLNGSDFLEIDKKIDQYQPEVSEILEKYGLDEARPRISGHIAMLYAFTEKALALIGNTPIQSKELHDFMMSDMCRTASTWQTPAASKRRDMDIPSQVTTPTKRPKPSQSFSEVVEQALSLCGTNEIDRFAKLSKTKATIFFRDQAVEKHLKSKDADIQFLKGIRDAVKLIPNGSVSKDARFQGESGTQKAIAVPAEFVSPRVIAVLSGTPFAGSQPSGCKMSNDTVNAARVETDDIESAPISHGRPELSSPDTPEGAAQDSENGKQRARHRTSKAAAGSNAEESLTSHESVNSHKRKINFDVPASSSTYGQVSQEVKNDVPTATQSSQPTKTASKGKQEKETEDPLQIAEANPEPLREKSKAPKKHFRPEIQTPVLKCQACAQPVEELKDVLKCTVCSKTYHSYCETSRRSRDKIKGTEWKCKICSR